MKQNLLILLFIFIGFYTKAQTDTSFWFAAPAMPTSMTCGGPANIPILLQITSYANASNVTLNQPAGGFSPISLNIPANTTITYNLSSLIDSLETKPSNTILNKGLKISSNNPVSIYVEYTNTCSPELYVLKGSNALGNEFYISAQSFLGNSAGYSPTPNNQFTIISTADNNLITITPSNNINGHLANIPFNITLNEGQTFSCEATSQAASANLAGSHLMATKPIAVTVSDGMLSGIQYGGCGDQAGDQTIPINQIGSEYVAVKGNLNGADKIYLTATQNSTTINVDGVFATTINTGQTYEVSLSNASTYLQSNYPVYCFQMSGIGCEIGQAILPQLTCSGSSNVSMSRTTYEDIFMTLLVKAGGENSFLINGSAGSITSSQFLSVPGTNNLWKYAKINFPIGTYPFGGIINISNSSSLFHLGILQGGTTSGASFGYFSNFNTINPIASATPSTLVCQNTNVQLHADTIAGATYSWTGPNGYTSSLQNPTINNFNSTMVGDYILAATVGTCGTFYDTIHLSIANCSCTTPFWTETFDPSPLAGWSIDLPNGANDPNHGVWEVNATEGGRPVGSCQGSGDNTLHVEVQNAGSGNGNGSGAYYVGGFSLTTRRKSVTPNISTIGKTNIVLSFDYLEGGTGTADNMYLEYSTDGGATWNALADPPKSSDVNCFPGYEWGSFTVPLPAACENISNLKIGFCWQYTSGMIGTDLSCAFNNINLSGALAIPYPNATADNYLPCIGTNVQLNADTVANATYSWTGPNGFTSVLQNPIINSFTNADTGAYILQQTVTGCAPLFDSININAVNCNTDTCKTTQISLNTGVDANGNLLPIGTQDMNWNVTSIQNALGQPGFSIPYNPFVIAPHPVWFQPINSRWINLNTTFTDSYNGPLNTHVEITRHFTTIQDDTFKVKTFFSVDNFINYFKIDGINLYGSSNLTNGNNFIQQNIGINDSLIFLKAGCHDITVSYGNYYGGTIGVGNNVGINIEGYIQSVTGDSSILRQNCVTNTPPTLSATDTINYCANCEPVSPNLTITSGLGCGNLDTVKVYFTTGYTQGQDTLQFTPQLDINSNFNASTGVLTLYGNANYGVWETVLRTVCYSSLVANNSNANTVKNVVISLGNALYNPANGHYYKLVNNGSALSWHDAKNAAAASNYFGLQGYLVTITDSLENNFLLSLLQSNTWIGASDSAVENIWRWVTGCEGLENGGQGRHFSNGQVISQCSPTPTGISANSNFVDWGATPPTGEPNNCFNWAEEDYAVFFQNNFGYTVGHWNDLPDLPPSGAWDVNSYIIEYGCMPNDPIVNLASSIMINLLPKSDTIINQTICQGAIYLGYSTTGIYKDTFASASGCDSVRTLNLLVIQCCQDTSYVLNQFANGPDTNNCFVLTVNSAGLVGNLTFKNQVDLNQNFDETYNLNFGCLDGNGADGIAIIFQNQSLNYLGLASDNVGTNQNPNQLKIEFDTWENNSSSSSTLGDPWYDHIAILKDGEKDHNSVYHLAGPIQASATSGNIEDCIFHAVRIEWKSNIDSLNIYFDGILRLSYNADIVNTIFSGNPFVYITIAGATGGFGNEQKVCLQKLGDNKDTTLSETICQGTSFLGYNTTGTFIDTFTSASGCDSVRTLNLTVNAKPAVVAYITPNDTICAGTTITLFGTGATTYAWSNAVTNNIAFTPSANNMYTVTGTDANGCSSTSTIQIVINPLPTIFVTSVPNPATICIGDSVRLTASGATSYAWTGGITNGTYFYPTTTTTYTVTATDNNGCTTTATQLVTVNPLPNVNSTPANATVCAGNSVTLTGTGATSYTWSGGIANATAFAPITTSTFTVTGTDANGCVKTNTKIVTVNPLPTVIANVTPNDTICASTVINLSGSGATTYAWSNAVTNNIAFTPSANNMYTVTGTDANGCSSTSTIQIVINPLPTIFITSVPNPTTICIGDSVRLTASGATSYAWTGGITNGTYFYPTTTTTYTVTATDNNGCTTTATQLVIVNPLPNVNSTPANATVCAGNSVTLTGTGATSYTWSGGITNATAFTPTVTSTFTVTGTDANGCVKTNTKILTVNPLPTVIANVTPNYTICASTVITLSGSGATTYAWSNAVTNNIAFTPSANNMYTVTGTDANSCSSTSTIQIIINPLPIIAIASIPNPATICIGDSVRLTASGATSYAWTGGITNGTYFYPTNTTTYTVTATDNNGCTTTATQLVTVNPLPNVNSTPVNATVCAGNSLTLTGTGATSYTWSGGIANATAFTPTTTSTFTITGTDANGCVKTNTKIVTVNPLPNVIANSTPDYTVCVGTSVTLTGGGAISYVWSNGVVNNISFMPTSTNIYTVTGTDVNGCVNTSTISIYVNPIPSLNINTTPTNAQICQGQAIALTASGGLNLVWSHGGVNGSSVSPTITSTYTVIGVNGFNCTASATLNVIVHPTYSVKDTIKLCEGMSVFYGGVFVQNEGSYVIPLKTIKGCDSIVDLFTFVYKQPTFNDILPNDCCFKEAISLISPNANTMNDYYWTATNGSLISHSNNTASFIFDKIGMQTINLTITPPSPCLPIVILDQINVHQPIAKIGRAFETDAICSNKVLTFQSVVNNGYTYYWAPTDLFASTLSSTTGRIKENTDITLTVTDSFNCVAKDSMSLLVTNCCLAFVPTAFSPNNDGKNDVIKPTLEDGIALKRFAVYNQWGQKVFETNQKDTGWDGYFKGSIMELDTYLFLLEYECNGAMNILKGDFTLLK